MILHLKLTNFRKHEFREFSFTEGLNVMRGSNESGKSSTQEAMLYAFFGSKVLRDSLAETVTWGRKESELKVELTCRFAGRLYTFTRSKAGAEVKGDDGTLITGQNEVSAFASQLLGADSRMAGSLMMASQSGLLGALDEGPAAVSGLMAKLADFDTVDRLMELANAELMTGSAEPHERQLASIESDLQALPDPATLDQDIEAAKLDVKKASADLVALDARGKVTLEKILANQTRLNSLQAGAEKLAQARRAVEDLRAKLSRAEDALAAAPAIEEPSQEALDAAEAAAAEEAQQAQALSEFQRFSAISFPELHWIGSEEDFHAEYEQAKKELAKAEEDRFVAKALLDTCLAGTLKLGGKCPTCGHSKHSPEEIEQHNREAKARVDRAAESLKVTEAVADRCRAEANQFADLLAKATAYQDKLRPFWNSIELSKVTFPALATWAKGEPIQTGEQKRQHLAKLKAQARAAQESKGRLHVLKQNVLSSQASLGQAQAALAELPEVDASEIKEALALAQALLTENSNNHNERVKVEGLLDSYRDTLNRLSYDRQRQQHQRESLQAQANQIRENIKSISFNNAFIAKLKKVKPAVTDHLWNVVLGAVSSFFSQLRGEESLVTKEKAGFKVNGHSVDSLSGSTRDILALALRVALTKTFIPSATFLCLDEPASGCDLERTTRMLAFLSQVGFESCLLASHDPVSESVANNIISL